MMTPFRIFNPAINNCVVSVLPDSIYPISYTSTYTREGALEYTKELAQGGSYLSTGGSFLTGLTVGTDIIDMAYSGSIYSPSDNRIYMSPFGQSTPSYPNWHYVDCDTGTLGTYLSPGGTDTVNGSYVGGAYSPTQNRIYLGPFLQSDPAQAALSNWHYIDCNTGTVGSYTRPPSGRASGYTGGCYSPIQNRIYFTPYSMGQPPADNTGVDDTSKWHYINCDDGTLGRYPNPGNAVSNAYYGSVYSPNQNRIYFVPSAQANQPVWHYINCDDGTVGEYPSPGNAVAGAYWGGVYSPTQDRIYFVPYAQADQAVWHYIDCAFSTGPNMLKSYTNTSTAVANAYQCGVYSPVDNIIYFAPYAQANPATIGTTTALFHYINGSDGTIGYYPNPGNLVNEAFRGGAYSPTENRIYFTIYNESGETPNKVPYYDLQSNAPTSKIFVARAELNNY
jgi:hypothetical protein